jgi:2-polyprenyl-3-methyl-5-hydroxy-6-metoxy-1,4-benzoquinol methylase
MMDDDSLSGLETEWKAQRARAEQAEMKLARLRSRKSVRAALAASAAFAKGRSMIASRLGRTGTAAAVGSAIPGPKADRPPTPGAGSVLGPPAVKPDPDRLAIFDRLLAPMTPGHMLDLATGHGKFAVTAKDRGWRVTAVDARTERMPFVEGIEWIQADVRTFSLEGYDLITIFGLLYHLGIDDQLDLLRRAVAARTLTVIDTTTTPHPDVVERGYEGWYFKEKLEAPTASWGNETSFWPHKDAFLRMLLDCGFVDVYVLTPGHSPNRTFYVCR